MLSEQQISPTRAPLRTSRRAKTHCLTRSRGLCLLLAGSFPVLSAHSAPPPIQFAAPTHYNLGGACDQLAVADLNGDGKPDLVVMGKGTGRVTILLNTGSGGFVNYTNYASTGTPMSVTTGDFNGDGKEDIAVVNYPGDGITAWLGNGDGSFQSARSTAMTINYSWAGIAAGDFNRDGKADLALARYGLDVLLGLGNGYFQPYTNYPISGGCYAAAAAYFNNDTNLDLVTANYSSSSATVFFGNGDCSFPWSTNCAGDFSEYHYAVAVGDFNGDGWPDVATLNYYNSSVSVRLNKKDGTFGAETRSKVHVSPLAIAVGDFNGDGNTDIVTANSQASYSLAVLPGNGDGTFAKAITNFTGISGNWANQSIAVADFNGDGRPDIASTRFSANSVSVLLNQSAPSLRIQQTNGALNLSWPDWTGYTLQSSTNLSLANGWSPVSDPVLTSQGRRSITNIYTDGGRYFRLTR